MTRQQVYQALCDPVLIDGLLFKLPDEKQIRLANRVHVIRLDGVFHVFLDDHFDRLLGRQYTLLEELQLLSAQPVRQVRAHENCRFCLLLIRSGYEAHGDKS